MWRERTRIRGHGLIIGANSSAADVQQYTFPNSTTGDQDLLLLCQVPWRTVPAISRGLGSGWRACRGLCGRRGRRRSCGGSFSGWRRGCGLNEQPGLYHPTEGPGGPAHIAKMGPVFGAPSFGTT
jgi:hypothetical protein